MLNKWLNYVISYQGKHINLQIEICFQNDLWFEAGIRTICLSTKNLWHIFHSLYTSLIYEKHYLEDTNVFPIL